MGGPTSLAPGQRRALAQLKGLRALRGFYLAGGSAVAIHLRHRRSDDLDLFSVQRDVDLEAVAEDIASLPSVTIVSATDTAIKLRLGNVPVDVVRYPYPLLRKASPGPEGFPVATLLDLAVMKLAAIASRGIHRDFWDFHEILTRTEITLARALDASFRCQEIGRVPRAPSAHVLPRTQTSWSHGEALARDPVLLPGDRARCSPETTVERRRSRRRGFRSRRGRRALDRHLPCPDCERRLAALEATQRALGALPSRMDQSGRLRIGRSFGKAGRFSSLRQPAMSGRQTSFTRRAARALSSGGAVVPVAGG